MKLRKTSHDSRGVISCILAATMILLIAFPSFAGDRTAAEEVPVEETVVIPDEVTAETDEDAEGCGVENVQTGYITMKAVSGNTSITN